MKTIYLDNNATTAVAPEVLEAMYPYLSQYYGNPSSMHTFGGQLHKRIEEARADVAQLLGAQPEEIIFTSCGTESDNTAIMSALESYPSRKHVITTRVEHPAVLNFCKHLARRGYRVTFLPVDKLGRLDVRALIQALDEDTAIVSIMYANNETGVIFPIEEIGEIVAERKILFHTDAVQIAGKIPIDLKELKVDMLSISGHKLHAPKGVGALYVRRGTRYYPYLIGGHQEHGRRAGTGEPRPRLSDSGEPAGLPMTNSTKRCWPSRGSGTSWKKDCLGRAPTRASTVTSTTVFRIPRIPVSNSWRAKRSC